MNRNRAFGIALCVLLSNFYGNEILGDTNVPLPVGTDVTVLTTSRTISGKLVDSPGREWMAVIEPQIDEPTLLRLSSVEGVRRSEGMRSGVIALSEAEHPQVIELPAARKAESISTADSMTDVVPPGALAIVSWNVQTGATSPKPDALRPQMVRGALGRLLAGKYPLLAVQEVPNADGAERLRLMLPGDHDAWAMSFVDTTDSMDNGFWYRKDLVQMHNGGVLFTNPEDAQNRPVADTSRAVHPPHVAHFAYGQFDFTLITVHLTFKGGDTSESAREFTVLLDYLDEYFAEPKNDPDVIICGDFNTPSEKSGEKGITVDDVIHKDGRFEAGPQALHVLVDDKTSRTSAKTGGKPAHNYDHFIVSNDCLEELIEARRLNPRVLTDDPRDPKQTRTSDHFPIVAFFRSEGQGIRRDQQ